MPIEDLKRWHWALIGCVVGLVLGFGQVYGGNEPATDLPSIGQQEFEEALRATPRDGLPVLDNVTVYPGSAGEPDLVTMDRRTDWGLYARIRDAESGTARANTRQVKYVQHRFYARKPFKPLVPVPGAAPVAGGATYTVRDYVHDLSKTEAGAAVRYRFAWWRRPATLVGLWAAGSTLLIGGVWPTVLNLLTGAGFGRRTPKDPDYDLSRFKSEPDAGKSESPAADAAAVEDHVRRLEEELARGLTAGVGAAGRDHPPQPPPVKPLVAAPLEVPAPAGDEDKEYQGEFYPVVKPHHDEPLPGPPRED
jgi:hypothetical protein